MKSKIYQTHRRIHDSMKKNKKLKRNSKNYTVSSNAKYTSVIRPWFILHPRIHQAYTGYTTQKKKEIKTY